MSNSNEKPNDVDASVDTRLEVEFFPDDIKTIKAKNSNNDLSKTELLKLLCYMEGEIQARDICIAVLKVCMHSHHSTDIVHILNLTFLSASL